MKADSVAFRVTKEECFDLPDIIEEVRTVDLEPKAMKMYAEEEELIDDWIRPSIEKPYTLGKLDITISGVGDGIVIATIWNMHHQMEMPS